MIDLTFLGTGAAIPSRERAMSSVAVRQGPNVVLFDCAEGTQRQLMLSPLSFMKITAIFVTGTTCWVFPGSSRQWVSPAGTGR